MASVKAKLGGSMESVEVWKSVTLDVHFPPE